MYYSAGTYEAFARPEKPEGADRKSAYRFQKYLEELGINATVRRTLGADIDAACGQLRREYEI